MLISLQIIMGIFLILSFMGYLLLVRMFLSIQWEFIPIFVFSSISLLVFVSGLLGQLYAGSLATMILGLLALVVVVALRLKETHFIKISFSLPQFCFFMGSAIFLLLLFQSKLTHYDNFSHWAIVLKQMLSTDAFPTPTSTLIDFKNYPLGTTSFLYYVCRFVGNYQPVMIVGQGLLIFSCFYAMFGIISQTKRFLLYAFLGLGLSTLSFFNSTIRISDLLVDFLLPIFTLALFAIAYTYRHDLKKAFIVIVPVAGLLTIIKSTGILFAVIGLLFLIYIALIHGKKFSLKNTVSVILTITASLTPLIFWNIRMFTVFKDSENKFEVSASGFQVEKTAEQMNEITSLFLSTSMDMTTRPVIGIVVFHVVVLIASLVALLILKKKWNLWKVLIALDVVLVLYYAGILALYLFSMPLNEATSLAGFERYASSIVVLFAGGLVLSATIDIERSFYYRDDEVHSYRAFKSFETKSYYQKGVIVCIACCSTLLLSEYNGIASIVGNYEETLPNKIKTITGDRWYENGEEDKSNYLFYASDINMQVTNFYLQYVAKYYLYAPNVDAIVLFYEDNMENLLNDYDYLVVVDVDSEGNHLLQKYFNVDMQKGIYKITQTDDGKALTLQ